MKEHMGKLIGTIRKQAAAAKEKTIKFMSERTNLKAVRTFAAKYGYYAGLALLLVLLGTASNAYRTGAANERPEAAETPIEASYVITPAPTATPAPVSEKAPIEYIWPVDGEILTPFSDDVPVWSETLGMWKAHEGIDILAEAGQSVAACADGIVADAFEDPLKGKVIVIEHEGGTRSVYANLNTLKLVTVGQMVSRGDIISAVGNTAAFESAMPWHLHFEFTDEDGEYADFSEYVSR